MFENKGHALLVVEELTGAPALLLYALYRDAKRLFIVMQYVSGQQLRKVWETLLIAFELFTMVLGAYVADQPLVGSFSI